MSTPISPLAARRIACWALALAGALGAAPEVSAQGPEGREASPLARAQLIERGAIDAYRVGESTVLAVPAAALGRPIIWYSEVVGAPPGTVSEEGLGLGDRLVRLERQGNQLHVRDLTSSSGRRAASRAETRGPAGDVPLIGPPGSSDRDPKRRPIEIALAGTVAAPVIASLPIAQVAPDGTLLVDATPVFSNDIPGIPVRGFVAAGGVLPAVLDPSKSYIERVRVTERSLNIRSHLTFLAQSPAQPLVGPLPVSIVVGHSWVFLPETPMAARPVDPRIGYFWTEYTEFETARGEAQAGRRVIQRFRLEKANPRAAVSDPVKPITFYIGPGVPERWKPWIRRGVLQWLPAFEAAGFSNALRVLDAPTPQQDPNWSAEDVTINVIRWLPQPRVNAMGPHVVDPRSGEVLSAHIQVWPAVVEGFGLYYYAMFGGGVDPRAARLPVPEEIRGGILEYAVAHEVGHTLGLMHNQLASTAWSVQQLRNRGFANTAGPNSSIMAYGRFNYVAQPGDGVTQLWGKIGPYDLAAIRYGYGVFGTDAVSEARELARFAETFGDQRSLYWGSQESGELISRFGRDPRVQIENVGAERVDATQLGVANLLRSLEQLERASAGDSRLYAETYATMLSRHVGLLKSVPSVVGAVMPPLGRQDGPLAQFVSAAEQRRAVSWLLGDGARSLEPYAAPKVVERVAPFGGYRAIDRLQASLVADLLNGPNAVALESQRRRDPAAYSSLDLAQDVQSAVWGALDSATPTQRALQRGYLEAVSPMLKAWAAGGGEREAAEANAASRQLDITPAAARALVETGDDTVLVAWIRASLPDLQRRLEAAARSSTDPSTRLHFEDMAVQVARVARLGAP